MNQFQKSLIFLGILGEGRAILYSLIRMPRNHGGSDPIRKTTHHSNRRHNMKEKTITALRCMFDLIKTDPAFFVVWGISLAVMLKLIFA